MIGPLVESTPLHEVELVNPFRSSIVNSIKILMNQGFKIILGRWLIEGGPLVILFDIESCQSKLEFWRAQLEKWINTSIENSDNEVCNSIIFGFMVAEFMMVLYFEIDFKNRRSKGINYQSLS